ncbi:DUF1947 domain-containing protein [Desulfurococcaceae archaeon MEX13E-LK6-19]|nr:DUF1947 domain-containing protein [Desulfurococcaceae archaeon MEX13E-LK6-19]
MPRRWYLSKKESKKLRETITGMYPNVPLEFEVVEKVIEKDLPEIIIVDKVPAFFIYEGKYYPLLTLLLSKGVEWVQRIVVVDMGAVKPLLRGADVMAPGIVGVKGAFEPGDPVVVLEEKYGKPFVVGKALVSSKDLVEKKVTRGKAVENLHRVGDKIWEFVRRL